MKKMNNKGTRTIENSRRDTFATTAGEYLNAVRNAYMADNLECEKTAGSGFGTNAVVASGTPDGTYFFKIDSNTQGTQDLMESGGKSPFGNTDVQGYVKWTKTTSATSDGGSKTKIVYSIRLADSGKHGLESGSTCEFEGKALKRTNVSTAVTTCTATTTLSGAKQCQLS